MPSFAGRCAALAPLLLAVAGSNIETATVGVPPAFRMRVDVEVVDQKLADNTFADASHRQYAWAYGNHDPVVVHASRTVTLAGGAMESVRFLLEHCARWGRPLKAGALVSTGAVTGVHRVHAGDEAVCIFKGIAELHCSVVRAEAQ